MKVAVTIDLTVPALKKHWRQMRGAAGVLTDAKNSVQMFQPPGNPKRLAVSFSVPKARQADVVHGIARQFWCWIEDYGASTIAFESVPRRPRRSRKS
jgi:hypothetical protein